MIPPASRDFGGVLVSTEHWPIVVMEFPERRYPDAVFRQSLEFIEELLEDARKANTKTFHITDLTRMREFAPASQRKVAADWIARTAPLQRVASLGGASVTPSAILRGLIMAVDWLQKSPSPTIYVATRKEAFDAAIKRYDEAQIPIPVRARLGGH